MSAEAALEWPATNEGLLPMAEPEIEWPSSSCGPAENLKACRLLPEFLAMLPRMKLCSTSGVCGLGGTAGLKLDSVGGVASGRFTIWISPKTLDGRERLRGPEVFSDGSKSFSLFG